MVWDHMGISEPVLARRVAAAVVVFVVAAITFDVLLYLPYAEYIKQYARRAGEAPSAWQTSGLGVVVSAGNSIIANCIWIGVPRLGFQRKDDADVVTFLVRGGMVLLNTLALVVLTAQKLSIVGGAEDGILSGTSADVSEELGRESALADNIFVLFLAGTFSFSYLGFWCTYPLTYLQAVLLIRSGVLGSDMTARQCERHLEPMEIWLPWDYASHIQLMCCVFVPLFFAEPPGSCASRKLCIVLLLWCGVMYCAQRVIHLRFSKETFFATSRLDSAVLWAWGFPIAQLAMASGYWAARAFDLGMPGKVLMGAAAGIGSLALYWSALYHVFQHNEGVSLLHWHKKDSYAASLARLRYSYFNTNPIHVLLGDLGEIGLKRSTWYEAGKAYLQTVDPRVHARTEAAMAAAEHAPTLQHGPRSLPGQLLYRAQVWLTGAPRYAFQSLDDEPRAQGW